MSNSRFLVAPLLFERRQYDDSTDDEGLSNDKMTKRVGKMKSKGPGWPETKLKLVRSNGVVVWITQTSAPISKRLNNTNNSSSIGGVCKIDGKGNEIEIILVDRVLCTDLCESQIRTVDDSITKIQKPFKKVKVVGNKWECLVRLPPKHVKGMYNHSNFITLAWLLSCKIFNRQFWSRLSSQ